jgi:hypothetical protein
VNSPAKRQKKPSGRCCDFFVILLYSWIIECEGGFSSADGEAAAVERA